jgi:hypothetical protein
MNELERSLRERIDWVQAPGLTIAAASAEPGVSVPRLHEGNLPGWRGFVIWYKRLERGTWQLPAADSETLELEAHALAMILRGAGSNQLLPILSQPCRSTPL